MKKLWIKKLSNVMKKVREVMETKGIKNSWKVLKRSHVQKVSIHECQVMKIMKKMETIMIQCSHERVKEALKRIQTLKFTYQTECLSSQS